ncbi:MAG: hypothetical protein QW566_11515 [Candidatus Jordarchaeales archaeon]
MLRYYKSRKTGASTTFELEPEPVRKCIEPRRTGFWLYAEVKPGTRVKAKIRRNTGVEEEKTLKITESGIVTSDGSFTPVSPEAGVFKLLEEGVEAGGAICL